VFFWGHTQRVPGVLDHSCFSQWFPSPFEIDGVTFATAEHFMMWNKAQLFDPQRADRVLAARSPAHAKALGREIGGFDEDIWRQHRWDSVVQGSYAKFSSTPALRSYLLGTSERVLVEASPVDRIWGIGLPHDAPQASAPHTWLGLNLLGFALMEARARLAS
jgi:hypothetical protein